MDAISIYNLIKQTIYFGRSNIVTYNSLLIY